MISKENFKNIRLAVNAATGLGAAKLMRDMLVPMVKNSKGGILAGLGALGMEAACVITAMYGTDTVLYTAERLLFKDEPTEESESSEEEAEEVTE